MDIWKISFSFQWQDWVFENYEVKLHNDETVSPVRQPYRRIAYHLIKPTELELEKQLKEGVIEETRKLEKEKLTNFKVVK